VSTGAAIGGGIGTGCGWGWGELCANPVAVRAKSATDRQQPRIIDNLRIFFFASAGISKNSTGQNRYN
jgi:hypothetical protein